MDRHTPSLLLYPRQIHAKGVKVEILESRIRFSAQPCSVNEGGSPDGSDETAEDEASSCSFEIGKRLGLRKKEKERKKEERKAKADRVSGRWQAALSRKANYVYAREYT